MPRLSPCPNAALMPDLHKKYCLYGLGKGFTGKYRIECSKCHITTYYHNSEVEAIDAWERREIQCDTIELFRETPGT